MPQLSDLRDSGALEQDADNVLFLHRDDYYEPTDNPGEALVRVAKQRNGPTGDVHLTFIKPEFRFEDATGPGQGPPPF